MQHNTTHHDALSAEQSEMECHVTFYSTVMASADWPKNM